MTKSKTQSSKISANDATPTAGQLALIATAADYQTRGAARLLQVGRILAADGRDVTMHFYRGHGQPQLTIDGYAVSVDIRNWSKSVPSYRRGSNVLAMTVTVRYGLKDRVSGATYRENDARKFNVTGMARRMAIVADAEKAAAERDASMQTEMNAADARQARNQQDLKAALALLGISTTQSKAFEADEMTLLVGGGLYGQNSLKLTGSRRTDGRVSVNFKTDELTVAQAAQLAALLSSFNLQ